jgi:DNA-binding protein
MHITYIYVGRFQIWVLLGDGGTYDNDVCVYHRGMSISGAVAVCPMDRHHVSQDIAVGIKVRYRNLHRHY